jgi:DNA-directed RNA polymerase subunit M/transcription elongation factor TFIIS
MKPYVFAKFKYIPESEKNNEIYLVCIPSENSKINTDLYYESHIPASAQILIIEGQKKTITKNAQYLRIKGCDVLALCMNVSTYYLEEISLDEYIEFVQMENDEANNDEDCTDMDEESTDAEADEDATDVDENNTDEEATDVDENNTDEEAEVEEDAEEDAIEDPEEDAEEDADVDEEAEVEEDVEEEADEEALDNDETAGGGGEIDDEPFEPKQSQSTNKRKKTGSSKSIKFNAGLDTSILFNILKKEDEKKLIPDAQLHLKRKINITILKLLDLPAKTIQYIEKGIYNYVIEKCSANAIIPIWENPEFNDMYISKSKSIYSNLNTKCYVGNKGLLEKVKKGKINPYELAFLESHKLYPEKWNDIIEEKAKMDKILKESLKESATDLFQCTRCKKRKTIYCEVQTRSSDEPMTKFITCLECGYKWKQY